MGATPELARTRRRIYRGVYEADEIRALVALLRPEDVVLELGGGCGVVSAIIANRLADSRNLHVVEANPALMASIAVVAKANGLQHEVLNAAVGLNDGRGVFHFDDNFLSSSAVDRGRGAAAIEVPFLGLAGLLERLQPTVVFADVEGYEGELFKEPLPERVRAVCLETHPHVIGDKGVSNVCRNLLSEGFNLLIDLSPGRILTFARDRP
ncbi:FkbM family methyltransferase [Phenylobacterium sp. J426]|uniref:FkbM family methyltransferase n=1 Tax=Phenylobacterium sp. J426 TaxID=2898439 RepID=UPI002150E7A2|nr:FkbM family methyltransferase [Phenylobacterium sp. J426]MCR5876537.1 FkbM family methyltransferase [Phenylobacterium sp. J426]